ncbi:helix-turn-helix domain-containing protein [Exiguobacterium sp. s166]|uniref:helix-turn-helix domain-containing protein n=1 Tax=Exiguobacterium sp. s166 TaxID=2751204 RepID=UPI001BE8CFD3|nr:helix-turn-helix transcriptional regulator [Exiguobacterium sp. s166]
MSESIIPLTNYGERIRMLWNRQGMELEQLAELTETTPEMMNRIEKSLAYPSFSMIERLAKVLGVPYEHLLRDIWPAQMIFQQEEDQKIIDLPSS